MRILLIEDEAELADWLARALRQRGFLSDHAPDARSARGFFAANVYDAIVLDLRLPDVYGLTLLAQLRDEGSRTPVLVLTAEGSLQERVRALHLGADDFLTKPFAVEELEARLTALVRRSHGRAHPRLQCGALCYESESRAFTLGGDLLALTPREHAALLALLTRSGAPVGKSLLSGKVFPTDSNVGPDAIELVLHRLRRKLADGAGDVHIVTVRGLGYLLEPLPPGGTVSAALPAVPHG